MPNTETNYEEAVVFLEGYLKNPSAVWKDAKIGVKTKLQWFQFPLGLTFENNFFGTTEMCSFFKAKSALLGAESATVVCH